MKQITLKNSIDNTQMRVLMGLFNSWNVNVEITDEKTPDSKKFPQLFTKTCGMWANRDIDVKKTRKEAYERRTKYYDNATL